MRHTIASALALTLALAGLAGAVPAELPRHPAPSPDGSTIAFSWQGDLWLVPATGGEARRLTANPASDRHPVWSRDGSELAFASDRHGNLDVFVAPVDGSQPPRRLTFASRDDVPVDFSADGSAVLFVSRRDESIRWMAGLYSVPVTGGTPTLVQPALVQWAALGPDGESLAFVRGATKWWRRGYRGSANRDLWLRTADGDSVQLTTFDGDDDLPSWVDAHTLAFLSSRAGRKNVFLLDLVTGEASQLTHHEGSDVRFPRASADGSLVAYEFEDGVWTVPTSGGEPHRLTITVRPDLLANPVERHTDRKGAEDLAVSPDGTLAAFVVHGDVFVTAVRSKDEQEIAAPPTVQITATAAREKQPIWAPDGKSLVIVSDRAGTDDLYTVKPADENAGWLDSYRFTATPLVATPAEEHTPRFSPDGKRIAFVRNRGGLVVAAADGSGEQVLFSHFEASDFRWSPDGAFIAYSIPDLQYNTEVWIIPSAGGTPYNVSRHPDEDVQPSWSPDGRRLVWVSKRHADTMDVWGVWLTRADAERTPEGWLQVFNQKGKKANEKSGEAEDTAADDDKAAVPEPPTVTIDFDHLWERPEAITSLQGDEGSPLVSPDGKRVVFTAEHEGERDLYAVRWDGKDQKRLTTGGQAPSDLQFSSDGKTLFYLDKDGAVRRVDLDGKAGDPVPFTARYEVDRLAERGEVFDEAWRALNLWFYDPAFHGVDWAAQHKKYRPWAMAASDPEDFADVVNLMLGELNASHMGYYPRGEKGDGDTTGWIGAFFDAAAGGPGILVREVLPDSPAARADVDLKPGERVLAVGTNEVGPDTNIYGLLTDTVKERTFLRVRGTDGSERTVNLVPVAYRQEYQLRYEEWVRQRRALVDKLSEGRLGYLHIQGMDMPSFEDFERSLYAAGHGKEGLIIDVRSNGGGWTTDYLMAALMVQRHAYTVPRGADGVTKAYPSTERLPLASWTRPALALCNQESYSNAEIFSHAFKTLKRGPLVGMPTFGAVISTGGQALLNGAWVRLPTRGWWVAKTGVNMEHHGAVPDVIVAQPVDQDTSATEDTQLSKAVQVMLDGLEKDPRHGAW